jgi:xanthine dehydrogenase small subunit
VGLWITKQLRDLPKIIHTGRAAGFASVSEDGEAIRIGAGATYADAYEALSGIDPDVREVLRRLGSKQVRASGTIGGNIANGSPIGDSPPLLIALGAQLQLLHGAKTRTMPLENFFIDYGKQDRAKGELVAAVTVPRLQAGQHFRAYKISKRFDQDISALLGAFCITLDGGKIGDARIAFGGMAATPKRAANAEAALTGMDPGDGAAVASAALALTQDYKPITDMRASADYRMQVAQNLLIKAMAEIAGESETRVTGRRVAAEAAQ